MARKKKEETPEIETTPATTPATTPEVEPAKEKERKKHNTGRLTIMQECANSPGTYRFLDTPDFPNKTYAIGWAKKNVESSGGLVFVRRIGEMKATVQEVIQRKTVIEFV